MNGRNLHSKDRGNLNYIKTIVMGLFLWEFNLLYLISKPFSVVVLMVGLSNDES